jgi:hypothetical protein
MGGDQMIGKRWIGAVAGAFLLVASLAPRAYCGFNGRSGIRHVLLLSIDGFHAVDYLNCVKAGTCPTLAALGKTGVNYGPTMTSRTIVRSIRPQQRPATVSSERPVFAFPTPFRSGLAPSTKKATTLTRST